MLLELGFKKQALQEIPLKRLKSLRNLVSVKAEVAEGDRRRLVKDLTGTTIGQAQTASDKAERLSTRAENLKNVYNMRSAVEELKLLG